ncbi:MAG TPA: hypothetical protein VFI65_20475 [Streptosporangiaceae bacterium]|nr:hypothetical protein [Streptosporangiaceae bacterium]
MIWAPIAAAVSSVLARLAKLGDFASTTRILQCGQAAEIIETSSVASTSQPVFTPETGSRLGSLLPS